MADIYAELGKRQLVRRAERASMAAEVEAVIPTQLPDLELTADHLARLRDFGGDTLERVHEFYPATADTSALEEQVEMRQGGNGILSFADVVMSKAAQVQTRGGSKKKAGRLPSALLFEPAALQ